MGKGFDGSTAMVLPGEIPEEEQLLDDTMPPGTGKRLSLTNAGKGDRGDRRAFIEATASLDHCTDSHLKLLYLISLHARCASWGFAAGEQCCPTQDGATYLGCCDNTEAPSTQTKSSGTQMSSSSKVVVALAWAVPGVAAAALVLAFLRSDGGTQDDAGTGTQGRTRRAASRR